MNPYTTYAILATFIFCLLMYEGVNLLFFQNKVNRTRRFNINKIRSNITKNFNDAQLNKRLEHAGFKTYLVSYLKVFNKARYVVILLLLIVLMIKICKKEVTTNLLLSSIFVYLITTPLLKVGKYFTPIGYVLKTLEDEYRSKQNNELGSIITQIHNIAISQQEEPTNLSYILTRVIRFSKYTKNAFIKLVSYLDQNDEENAKQSFIDEINTSLAKDLVYVLVEMDRINPAEVIKQLKVLEDRVKSENMIHKNKKEEFYSNMLYLLPTGLCFVILMNFLRIILSMVMGLIPLQ